MHTITLYDTTLRDGTQGEGVSLSLMDKIRITEKLSEFGMHYVEGGWPGSNPKDIAYFAEIKKFNLGKTKIAAFGSTRRAGKKVQADTQIAELLKADTPVVTIFGKSWKLHVEKILGISCDENLKMICDTVQYLKAAGRETFRAYPLRAQRHHWLWRHGAAIRKKATTY